MSRWIHRPSAAMGVACLALLVALGGTSVATVSQLVPRNSVGTAQIRNVAVTRPKLRNNVVNSAKVANRSLLTVDFAQGQLPAGPAGPAGAQGPAGPAGPPGSSGAGGYQVVRVQSPSNSTSTRQVSADCPAGKRAIGGSVRISGFVDNTAVTASSAEGPVGAPDFWFAAAREVGPGQPGNWALRVDVICLTVT